MANNDIFDVDYSQFSADILPINKRWARNITLVKSLLSPVQWCRDFILGSYKLGSNAPVWAAGTYNKYQQVIYKKQVYESLINNNTDTPGTTANWRLFQDDFIGVDERIKFNSQKCVLEYALNKRFGGTFRMLPSTSNSDIYISKVPSVIVGFLVGQTIGSTIGATESSDTIGSVTTSRHVTGYSINFKSSLFALTSETEVRDYVDKYNATSIRYTIITY